MSRRKRLLLWTLPVVALTGLGMTTMRWTPARQHRITPENVQKLPAGMSLAEVEALFGAPPGVYTAGDHTLFAFPVAEHQHRVSAADREGCTQQVWVGDVVGISVFFQPDGTVRGYNDLLPIYKPTVLERFCRWLGL
jgi:hypothetical protein